MPPLARPAHNLFFAILPDEPAAWRLERLAGHLHSRYALSGRPLGPERYHVSLQHLGLFSGLPHDLVAIASDAAASAAAHTDPFEIVFTTAATFSGGSGQRAVVVYSPSSSPALENLRLALRTALLRHGLGVAAGRKLTLHITLFYDRRGVTPHEIEPVLWVARQLVLIHSVVGQGRHIHLARFAFSAREK